MEVAGQHPAVSSQIAPANQRAVRFVRRAFLSVARVQFTVQTKPAASTTLPTMVAFVFGMGPAAKMVPQAEHRSYRRVHFGILLWD